MGTSFSIMSARYRHVRPIVYVYLGIVGLTALINQALLYVTRDVLSLQTPVSRFAFFQYQFTVHEIQAIFHDLQEITAGAFVGTLLSLLQKWGVNLRRRLEPRFSFANQWVIIWLIFGVALALMGYLGFKLWQFYGIAVSAVGESLPNVQVLPFYGLSLIEFSHMLINSIEVILGGMIGLVSTGLSDALGN
jgi:hypothetical protein